MPQAPPPAPPPDDAPPSADAAVSGSAGAYRVQLPSFEGPLDLLLHLIEEHELDIRDIPIAFVAKKYVEYITLMDQLNIDVASEYLVMAATLAHIKSKMLLPTPPEDQEEDEEADIDPRAELVRRLLEYQKYKQAAEQLAAHDLLGRDVFPRGMPAPNVDGPAPLAGLSLFKLLDAFQHVLSRAKATIDHQIDLERFSITDRINELSDLLRTKQRATFDELFVGQRTRIDLIITFLALLEMTRLRLIRLYQEGPLEMIMVELAVTDDGRTAEDELAGEASSGDMDEASVDPDEIGEESADDDFDSDPSEDDPLDEFADLFKDDEPEAPQPASAPSVPADAQETSDEPSVDDDSSDEMDRER